MDAFFMARALKLAKKGEAWVSPNPMVGAVIVKDNRVIGEGYHEKFGENHAEINAIDRATETIEGATIYVNLEPCTHYGKMPPCIDRIIACKPARVVIGTADPNPLVAGGGIKALKQSGIETTLGVLADECKKINERFFKFIRTGTPFVTLKYAQTLDGRIATSEGHSQWVSSGKSLKFAHALRSHHDAVLIGVGTLLRDNPELTTRLVKGRNPLRIVVDSHLRTPLDAGILKNQTLAKTMIATTGNANSKKRVRLDEMGIETVLVAQNDDHCVDLTKLFAELGKRKISSVLVEGGASVITSVLKDRLADRVVIIIAPKIVGKGFEAVGDLGIKTMDKSLKLICGKILSKGDDLIIDGRIEK